MSGEAVPTDEELICSFMEDWFTTVELEPLVAVLAKLDAAAMEGKP